jgi:hypothetical protein
MERQPLPIAWGDEARALAQRLARQRRRRTRRRLVALAALGVLGLALGTIWATGFADTGGTTGSDTGADPIFMNNGQNQDNSGLNGLITSNGDLTFNFQGRNGSLSSFVMYDVNLTSQPVGNLHYVSLYLTNTPNGFSDLQIQMRISGDGGNGCQTSDLTGTATGNYRNFIFVTNDAQVTFQGLSNNAIPSVAGLPGGARYCVGVVNYTGSGGDITGTFIRRNSASTTFPPGVYPTFVASVNRSS